MRYCELKEICKYLSDFKYIKLAKRVENNTIKIVFDKKSIFFDLTKSNSTIYIKDKDLNYKEFNAPFDNILQKKFINSTIKKVEILNNDKILKIEVLSKSKYKKEISSLILEFTGKYTNIIIVDDKFKILEALHHIDEYKSIRIIKINTIYAPPPKPIFCFKDCKIKDVKYFLKDNYEKLKNRLLNSLKMQKINQIDKEIKKISTILSSLESKNELIKKEKEYYELGNLLLSNIYKIKQFDKDIQLIDFNGNIKNIKLPQKPINQYIDELFKKGKKYKQKILNQDIQKTNLTQKLTFLENLSSIIKKSNSIDEIEQYYPKKDKNKKITKKEKPFLEIFYNGYIIRVGRNEKENIYLLENSKASDFWFHLQGQKSSHLIVLNRKKELPSDIINKAGEILAKISGVVGSVNIDYTQRRFVNIQNKANVLYNRYKTITLKI